MIVWINGCHGVGKTSVARSLQQLLPDAFLFDPEQIGFMLRRVWPQGDLHDFKDLPIWRDLTVDLLSRIEEAQLSPTTLVPMTLSDPLHHDEVIDRLGARNVRVQHFTLMASEVTLRRRLRWRMDRPSSRAWARTQNERCAASLQDARFATHIATDGRSIGEVAAEIAGRLHSDDEKSMLS